MEASRMIYRQFPDMVTEEECNRRINICNQCKQKVFDKNFKKDICKLCSCLIFAQAQLKASKCPIGKW